MNGVPARYPYLFDSAEIFPEYEEVLIDRIQSEVHEGDQVVIIGGGFGVSSIHAAQRVGVKGSVTTYEASNERYSLLTENIEINGLSERIDTKHALVGSDVAVAGSHSDAISLDPGSLPPCEIIVMDCEGSELEIIPQLNSNNKTIILETHGCYGAKTEKCRKVLNANGFKVVDEREDDPSYGIDILTAHS